LTCYSEKASLFILLCKAK